MNDYLRITSGEVKLNVNSEIEKNEIIKQTPEFLHFKTYYINGLVLEFRQLSNEIVLTTNNVNMNLNDDGTIDFEV